MITNNPWVLEDQFDGRVKSSIGSKIIVFPAYSARYLLKILAVRSNHAFKPGMVELEAIVTCVNLIAERMGDAQKNIRSAKEEWQDDQQIEE